MQRVMLGQTSVPSSPKQKRLSVGFGVNASVQIHKTTTPPPSMQQWPISTNSTKSGTHDDGTTPSRRKSLHEALLMRLLSTPSDEPLFRQPSADEIPESQRTADDSFDSCLSGRGSPIDLNLLNQTPDAMRCITPTGPESVVPPNRHMQLLMRDFNSPSATARMRAVRALNSVTKRNAYGNFDVSYAEQDIITDEERLAQEKRTIQDVMRNVCVYVEVRSGTDNRSEGIKEHIASLGAKVNERLLRDTTHVIFKDGLLSTYQKAKKFDIPIVSILWIEACKRHTCLMNPNDFKISNLERYENPDLFKRIRRQKSMQPGAEEVTKKRPNVAAKAKAPVAVISPPSKLPVLHRIRNDDRLERILNDFEAENQITSSAEGPIDEYDQLLQAAPMRILERFRSTPTPMDREEEDNQSDGTTATTTTLTKDETPRIEIPSRRALFGGGCEPKSTTPRSRRKTVIFTPQMTNVEEEPPATVPSRSPNAVDETPKQTSLRNRRKTIVIPANEAASAAVPDKSSHDINNVSNRRNVAVTKSSTTTTRTIRTRRSTLISNELEIENVSSRQNRSSLCEKQDQNQPEDTMATKMATNKTITVAKETGASVSVSKASSRSRRKTIAFGNEENTPPLAAAISMDFSMSASKIRTITMRDTVCSPKDMEMSSMVGLNRTDSSNKPISVDSTKLNSNATSVISISSDEGNRSKPSESLNRNRRRTLFIPSVEGAMDGIVPAQNDTARSSLGLTTITNRRGTKLFTPRNSTPMEALEVSETPPELSQYRLTHADGSSIVNRPNPTSSSTPISAPAAKDTVSAINGRKTLLEQYNDSLLFSSTRAPDKRRRTVFDITMDIMGQRLSEINRQAAEAAKAAKKSSECDETSLSSGEANPVQTNVAAGMKSPTPQPLQSSLDAYYRKASKSCEKSSQQVSPTTEPPRKRKLFNIQTSEEEVMGVRKSPATTITKPAAKRRSLAPAAGGGTKNPTITSSTSKKRRTTALFTSPIDPTQRPTAKEDQRMKLFPVGRGLPTMASQHATTPMSRQYLATTNLHAEQSTFVKEAIASLDGFVIEANVTDNTTHLVTLESRRTVNLLRALIRGLWIVRYEWIVESYHAGRWLPEERFELSDFSRAVQLNRSERQAFGSQYRNELFADYAPFWISPRCAIPVQQLRELIVLCRGKVTGNAARAKFLVVEPNDSDAAPIEGQIVVAPVWILDSITINKVKKLSKKYRVE